MLSNLEPSHMWDLDLSFMIGTLEGRNALTNNICLGTFPTNNGSLTEQSEPNIRKHQACRQKGTTAMAFPLSVVVETSTHVFGEFASQGTPWLRMINA